MKMAMMLLFFVSSLAWSQANDPKYLDQMILHFEDTIRLEKIALEKSSSLEIKRMARKATREEKGWVKKLKHWRQKYYEDIPEDISLPLDTKVLEVVKEKSFDELFIKKMIEHHNKGIDLLKEVRAKTTRRFIHQFCEEAEIELSDEVQLLHELHHAYMEDRLTP